MPEETRLLRIKQLVEELESADAFERRDAIETLALLTQARHGFDWRGAPEDRAAAVRRWRRWVNREQAKRKSEKLHAALQQLASGQASDEALGAIFGIEGATKAAIVAQVAAQMAGQTAAPPASGPSPKGPRARHPACDVCQRRPATVGITRRADDGSWLHREACEVCWRSI